METFIDPGMASPMSAQPNPRIELGNALILAALPATILRRLHGNGPYGVVVVAPSSKHVDILADTFNWMSNEWDIHSLDSPTAWGANKLVDGLAKGRVVVAICSDLHQVPASFKALADDTVKVKPHDASALRKTMSAILEGRIPRLGRRFSVHPDPELLCRCIMPGLRPRKVVDALTKLGELGKPTPSDPMPDLERAIEFGEARAWGLQVRSDLEAWRAGILDSADLDTTVLLVSPPGCGKTTFARVLAKGLGVQLMELKLGDLFVREGHLGDVISEMRQRFSDAFAAAPAVLLLDELDSLGRRDERERSSSFKVGLINELLTLLDGAAQKRPGMVVIGATNAPDAIDPAMRRPGRLGRTIELAHPGPEGIANILRFHLRENLRAQTIDEVVRLNYGSTPAELMDLVRRARQNARSMGRPLEVADLLLQTTGAGPIDWQMTSRVAIHEAGHALACLLLPDAPLLHSVSIVTSGSKVGMAMTGRLPGAMTRKRLEAQVMVALAGRAAEALVYGEEDPSEGASADLDNATSILCRIHASCGMGDSLLHFNDPRELLLHDRGFSDFIGAELKRLMAVVMDELRGRETYLHEIAFGLCTRRVLSGTDVARIVGAVNGMVENMTAGEDPAVDA